jgi:signal transduction histidine kinase
MDLMSPSTENGLVHFPKNDPMLTAMMDVVRGLDLRSTLERIVISAALVSNAKYAALGIIDENGHVQDFITHGMDEAAVARMASPPRGDGVLGLLINQPEPIRLTKISEHPASVGFPDDHPPMGSFLGVPVRVRGAVFGNLYLTEKADAAEFSDEDEEMVMALASIAGLSIENARLSEKNMSLAVYQDRDRIARDMHDLVIQRIFATGLTLQSIIPKLSDLPDESEKLKNSIQELNNTISELRQTILHLTSLGSDEITLRRRVMSEVESYRKFLKSTPSIRFEGLVDTKTSDVVGEQIVASLRELLSNAVKHADATSLSVSIELINDNVVLTVIDDGVGIPESGRRSGLTNLANRAEELGGTFEITRQNPSGTKAVWAVPVKKP